MSLLDRAIESSSRHEYLQEQRETALIVAGNKGGGKTTLLHLLLEKNEPAKPTLALDYTFGRRSGKSLGRDVCHLWELGGGSTYTSLLSAPLAAAKLEQLSLILVLDLSKPNQLWTTLESIIGTVRKLVNKLAEMESGASLRLKDQSWARVGVDHNDMECIDPFPIPLVIIGAKYDLFQDLDPEKKKVVCRSLRYTALCLGASLYFFNTRDPSLAKRAKDLLSHHAFGTQYPKNVCQDPMKPLAIHPGLDSLQLIGGPGAKSNYKSHATAMERWKHMYTALYPQEDSDHMELPDDPCRDANYLEPEIDALRLQKNEELEKYRQESSRRKYKQNKFK